MIILEAAAVTFSGAFSDGGQTPKQTGWKSYYNDLYLCAKESYKCSKTDVFLPYRASKTENFQTALTLGDFLQH